MSNTEDGLSPLSAMNKYESLEYFSEGLKKAASCARQLGILQENEIWMDISRLLDEMHNTGIKLANIKPLTRQETLNMIDQRQKRKAN